jgi:hypothetical protein
MKGALFAPRIFSSRCPSGGRHGPEPKKSSAGKSPALLYLHIQFPIARMDSVGDGQLSLLIEDMDLLGIESEGHALSGTDLGVRLDTSGNRIAVNIEIQEYFSAE